VETLEKMRKVKLGKKLSEEHCKSISKAMTGRKLSEEHCKSISKAHIGKKHSEETLEKKRKAQQGEMGSNAKLTNEKILAIRAEYTGEHGEYVRMAKKYSVCLVTIRNIILRKSWKHI